MLLKMKGINKSFSTVKVLNDVEFTLDRGEVCALLGENGAGKSTLIKILGGVYSKDSGEIYIEDELVQIHNVADAERNGIRIIHQDSMLIPYMTVTENIFLGSELKTKINTIDYSKMRRITQSFLDKYNLSIGADTIVEQLSLANQKMIEIIRAVSFDAKIVVMDEPTTVFPEVEVEILFDMIRQLKSEGVGIIYISHRMSEIFEISDTVTVLRDGNYIDKVETAKTDNNYLVRLMVGRPIDELYSKQNHSTDEVLLKVNNLSSGSKVKDVSFDLYKGEILGFSGLVGSGRSEAAASLFGLQKIDGGTIEYKGELIKISNVDDAKNHGLGLVPEDRKREGIYPAQGVRFNTTIQVLDKFLKHGRYKRENELDLVKKYVDDIMDTKYHNLEQHLSTLSGGNQQKVVISRWLLATSDILILDEPTVGIDVKTKSDIYHLMDKLTQDGLSIILISSDMPELINMCDRIVVMSQGFTTGVLENDEFDQEKIMQLSTKENMGVQM